MFPGRITKEPGNEVEIQNYTGCVHSYPQSFFLSRFLVENKALEMMAKKISVVLISEMYNFILVSNLAQNKSVTL